VPPCLPRSKIDVESFCRSYHQKALDGSYSCAGKSDIPKTAPSRADNFARRSQRAVLKSIRRVEEKKHMRRAMIATTVLLGLMCFEGCSDSGKDNSPAQQGATGSGSASDSSGTSGDTGAGAGNTPATAGTNTNGGGSGGSGSGNGQGTQPAGQGGQGTSTTPRSSGGRR
jgi:hypothetical protein